MSTYHMDYTPYDEWRYKIGRYDYPGVLEEIPKVFEDDPVVATASAQIKIAIVALTARIQQLSDERDWGPQ